MSSSSQPASSPDIAEIQWSRACDRVVERSIHPNFQTVSLRRGDKSQFGDERIRALTAWLDEEGVDVSLTVPEGDPESDPGKLLDRLIGRLNRQLTASANARRLPDRRLVKGQITFSLRAGDRTRFLRATGSKRSQTTLEEGLVDHVARETGGGARLVISGAQLETQTAEQFFGSQNQNVVEADIEQGFLDLMANTTMEVNGYLTTILVAEPDSRRKVFWQILKSMERTSVDTLVSELLQPSNNSRYLFFTGQPDRQMRLMTVDELLASFHFSRTGLMGLAGRLPNKKRDLQTSLVSAFSNGGRFFRISA